MRVLRPESHDMAHGAVLAMSGAGLTLMAIALLGAHPTGLIVMPTASLTAYLVWQVAWFARHRMAQQPRGPHAVLDTVGARVARVGLSGRRFGTPLRNSCDPTI